MKKRTAASFDAAAFFSEKISNALRFALGIVSGKVFFICSSETPAGVSELLFHGRGGCLYNFSCENGLPERPQTLR